MKKDKKIEIYNDAILLQTKQKWKFQCFFVSVDFQNALWKLCVNKTKFFKAKPIN